MPAAGESVDVIQSQESTSAPESAADTPVIAKKNEAATKFDEPAIASELSARLNAPEVVQLVPHGLKLLPEGPENVENHIHLMNEHSKFLGEDSVATREEILQQYESPSRPESDRFCILDTTSDELVALVRVYLREPTGVCWVFLVAKPYHPRKTEIERAALKISELLVMGKESRVPAEKPIIIDTGALETEVELVETLKSLDFEYIRSWYGMKIKIGKEEKLPTPEKFPAHLELRPYNKEEHGKALHAAHQEAFRDHSGHAEDTPFDRWNHYVHGLLFKPETFYVLWDGDEIAAGVLADDESKSKPGKAQINLVFCRKPWRKQGIASNLLRHAFVDLQSQGFTEVELGVDSKSKTNAVALYERVGMKKDREFLSFRKLVRGNPEDVID